ncbi:peroxisomal N(1)-acetyl-spermine/spermidine oxidase-like isoform X2 [Cylas formicarius]|uniref:peroxisomal N(1)-acetyl-spermine/spermidine oxidase-like isoform X2 n=1 Tax=Cylas formicarius TaxID=197179 RepID=UPI0029585497|nr:peroxisomal N(1)-acetyl-spermine/spermidine oxidase-like isoform X2 [Cylas formicarius]
MSTDRQPEIIVIGGGAAGFAAATRLAQNGFDGVKILEAEGRIGGRLHSVQFGGSVVDLGGTWVHGETGNVVFEKARGLDVLSPSLASNYNDLNFCLSSGDALDKKTAEKFWKVGMAIMENERAANSRAGKFGEYFEEAFKRDVSVVASSDYEKTAADLILGWFKKFVLCLDPAESWNDMSVKGPFYFKRCPGDQMLNWRDKGYTTILDILMNDVADVRKRAILRENVLLGREVTRIHWHRPDRKVEVTCADGSAYIADHVIMTVSVGALKLLGRAFVPELPERKAEAVEAIPLGTADKILLKFPTKWWPDDVNDFSLLWRDEDRSRLVEEFGRGPVLDGRSWLEDIFGFYTVDSHPNVLLGWVVGPMARQVELLADQIVLDGAMFLLRKFVGKRFDIPEPDGILRSKWGTNPHFNGSYSYVSARMEATATAREDLVAPLEVDGNPVVLFAGEATHATFFSSAHGAIESGYREADRLIDWYKRPEFHRIVIVGAGMAGLGAAVSLRDHDFVVLEAQSKPGGRIDTVSIAGKPIDLGAQWLHGKDNPLYELAVKHNLICDETSEEGLGIYVRSNGEVLDDFLVRDTNFRVGLILDDCAKLLDSPDHSPSLDDFLTLKFREVVLDGTADDVKLELYDWHKRFQVIDNSCVDLKRLSAKKWGEYVCQDDVAHFNLTSGYEGLIDVIVDALPRDSIRYHSEVTRLDFVNDHQIRVVVNGLDHLVCDHLILTPSLGVLKESPHLRQLLPEETNDCVKRLGFHGISKIYLFFDHKWWTGKGFQLLWTEDCDFEEKDTWLRHVTGFDEVLHHPEALMTWVGGEVVAEVENLDENDIGRQCASLLGKFLTGFCRVPFPIKVVRTRWLSNPYVRGSYCHITPECDEMDVIRQLGEPVVVDGIPRVLLAGEAVHPSHYSTTHGAFESGERQARVIRDYLRKSDT